MMVASYIKRKGNIVGIRVKDIRDEEQLELFYRCLEAAGKKIGDEKITDIVGCNREIILTPNEIKKFIQAWNN